jgi:predicted phosphate transport protein (TIGR00153 family)
MALKEWMTPQEAQFFDLLEREVATVAEGAEALRNLLKDYRNVPAQRQRIKDIEHRADEIVHSLHDHLNQSFVTPLAKEDLSGLASSLDDVLDYINAAATRLAIYGIDKPTEPMVAFADIIVKAVEQLRTALKAVRARESRDTVLKATIEVNRLENLADDLLNSSLEELLKGTDPLRIIKFKELYETLEVVTDCCEDVANILEDIVVKGR